MTCSVQVPTSCARSTCSVLYLKFKVQLAFFFISKLICGFQGQGCDDCLTVGAFWLYRVWGTRSTPRQPDPRPLSRPADQVGRSARSSRHLCIIH